MNGIGQCSQFCLIYFFISTVTLSHVLNIISDEMRSRLYSIVKLHFYFLPSKPRHYIKIRMYYIAHYAIRRQNVLNITNMDTNITFKSCI